MYFSCRWQTECPPRHLPTPRAVWEAAAPGQNKSLAGEQPCRRRLLSNPSPDNIFTKFLSTPPSSGARAAWLPPIRLEPPTFPNPHRNICSSHGAKDTRFQRAIWSVGGVGLFFCFGLSSITASSELRDPMFTETSSRKRGVY